MENKKDNMLYFICLFSIVYLILIFSTCHINVYMIENNVGIFDGISYFWKHMLMHPFSIFPINWTAIMAVSVVYLLGLLLMYSDYKMKHTDMEGKEYGSNSWFKDYDKYNKKYVDPEDKTNMIFSNEVKLNMNTRKTRKNNNVLVIGGSGTGKSRFCVKPNLLQANCSYVVTDPSGELLKSMGCFLEDQGYKIKVFDLTNMATSSHYNPFHYIRDEEGVLLMINCLFQNTNQGKKGGDPFWENSEKALLSACCFYLIEKMPREEQNFANVMKLLTHAEIKEDDPDNESVLDILMKDLENENPESMAVKNYKIFKMAGPKTAMSILISAGVRLQVFNFKAIKTLTSDDTLDLGTLGDNKQALFVVIPAADDTFNFLVSMMYSQLFETLYYHAEHDFPELRLPVHVRFLLDEFANIGSVPSFDKKLSTMRKYEISCTVILQSLSQLKSMYEKVWEVLVDNCDSLLFLGCQGEGTLKYINTKLGKKTIRTRDVSESKGAKGRGSTSTSYKKQGRDMLTPEEISQLDDDKCLLFIRGLKPFFNTKYTLEKHPNYKYCGDATKKLYYYDPNKDIKKVTTDYVIIDDLKKDEDVNSRRIQEEKERAESVNSGVVEQTKNGHNTLEFKQLEKTAEELVATETGELELEAVFDSGYEFRTNKVFMFDFENFDLEDQEEEEDDFFGDDYSDEEPPDVEEIEENFDSDFFPEDEEPNDEDFII